MLFKGKKVVPLTFMIRSNIKGGYAKCSCGDRIKAGEKRITIMEDGRKTSYCMNCERIALLNNPIEIGDLCKAGGDTVKDEQGYLLVRTPNGVELAE